jgi:hypothetical protein
MSADHTFTLELELMLL